MQKTNREEVHRLLTSYFVMCLKLSAATLPTTKLSDLRLMLGWSTVRFSRTLNERSLLTPRKVLKTRSTLLPIIDEHMLYVRSGPYLHTRQLHQTIVDHYEVLYEEAYKQRIKIQ